MADLKITQLDENTTPASTDVLAIVDDPSGSPETQKITVGNLLSAGSGSWVTNESLGTGDGSTVAFDTDNEYVAGSIQVYRDGQLMTGGGADYTETDSNTITFTTAPLTGSVLLATYQTSAASYGNADTLDGQHAPTGTIVGNTDTQTLTNKTIDADSNTISNIDASMIDNRTRKMFFPATAAYSGGAYVALSALGVEPAAKLVDGADNMGFACGFVPSDFVSLTSFQALYIVNASANAYVAEIVRYGAVGETESNHSYSSSLGTQATTNNVRGLFADISSNLSSLAAGDYFGYRLQRDASNAADTLSADLYFIGVVMTYTADM